MIRNEANIRQTHLWKSDSWSSVEFYNNWFLSFAPTAFKSARHRAIHKVNSVFRQTNDLISITVDSIFSNPSMMEVLRMVTAPPLAQDRLSGLSYSNKSILKSLEQGKIPKDLETTKSAIAKMLCIIEKMIDKDIFPWMSGKPVTPQQRIRSASIVADRLTGILSDPIIRNAQEKRQFDTISNYLISKGYSMVKDVSDISKMQSKSYSFHVNVPVNIGDRKIVNMPIDVVIKSSGAQKYPLLIECKSAGDFANTNKRRKEEAAKIAQLRATYGEEIGLCLYLCGYFDTGYLGYEAAEGIDWIWEHRTQDFELLGI